VYLKQGRLALARDWAHARGLSADDEISYMGEFEHLILARLLMAEVQSRQARRSFLQATGLLERLLKAAGAQNRTGSVIEILVAQALAHRGQGNHPLALASLERALSLAQPEGYVRLFMDEGEPMHLLLLDFRARMKKQSSGQSHPLLVYVERLLSGFGRTEEIHPVAHPQKVNLIEPLSERELEVLKLLRTELSGPEIADQLVISPNTFRTHTKNIFSKLGVNNRRAAVRRAEELDLF
jgi:LuxR family maltose regulon positive regulatory protein